MYRIRPLVLGSLLLAVGPALSASEAAEASADRSAAPPGRLDDPPRLHGASGDADEADVGWNRRYLASIPGDAGRIVTSPARWTMGEWGTAVAVGGLGIVLYAEDERIEGWVQRRRNHTTDRIARVVKPFGREMVALGLVGFAVASPFVDDERVTRTALLGAESMLFAGIGYESLQLLTNRPRPDTGAGRDAWGGIHGHNNHSFPSGHTTAAFAFATVVANEWKAIPEIPVVAYGMATAVGLSRMNDDAHWASDVLAGAVLGYASATAVEYLHRSRHDIVISPVFSPDEKSIAVTWSF